MGSLRTIEGCSIAESALGLRRRSASVRQAIEPAVATVFGVDRRISVHRRGVRRVPRSRAKRPFLAHVVCGVTLTEVGTLFAPPHRGACMRGGRGWSRRSRSRFAAQPSRAGHLLAHRRARLASRAPMTRPSAEGEARRGRARAHGAAAIAAARRCWCGSLASGRRLCARRRGDRRQAVRALPRSKPAWSNIASGRIGLNGADRPLCCRRPDGHGCAGRKHRLSSSRAAPAPGHRRQRGQRGAPSGARE